MRFLVPFSAKWVGVFDKWVHIVMCMSRTGGGVVLNFACAVRYIGGLVITALRVYLRSCQNSYRLQGGTGQSTVWSDSITSGTIHSDLKAQYITVVHKKGDCTDPANYRPVSLTSHLI